MFDFIIVIIFFVTLLGETTSASILWDADELMIALMVCGFVVPTIIKWIVRGFPNYQWKFLFVGLSLLLLGSLSGVLLEQYNYWFFHSLWHISFETRTYTFIRSVYDSQACPDTR